MYNSIELPLKDALRLYSWLSRCIPKSLDINDKNYVVRIVPELELAEVGYKSDDWIL